LWIEECLEPEVKKGDDSQRQYYVSVLEYWKKYRKKNELFGT
jgi:hypothetical protein